MLNLLFDEDDYVRSIQNFKDFCEVNGIDIPTDSQSLVLTAISVMYNLQLSEEEFVLLGRLVYNIGYRDNKFFGSIIH